MFPAAGGRKLTNSLPVKIIKAKQKKKELLNVALISFLNAIR